MMTPSQVRESQGFKFIMREIEKVKHPYPSCGDYICTLQIDKEFLRGTVTPEDLVLVLRLDGFNASYDDGLIIVEV